MLTVHAFATPNSLKVPIALEELGLPYVLKPVNIRQGEQKAAGFLQLNPNGKVPLLQDGDFVLSESAAILVHLAEQDPQARLLPRGGEARARTFEWLFFHASGVSPAFGNAGYFQKLAAEPLPAAIERFVGEAKRLLRVMETRLERNEFLNGEAYSIADIVNFAWLWRRAFAGVDFDGLPHLARWYAAIEARPAVQRAITQLNALVPS